MTNDVRPATGPQKTRKISVIQDRNRATLAHFGGILGIIPSAAVFYVSRNNAPFAEQEAREAMNFTLLPSIALVALWVVSFLPGMGNIAMVLGALVWLFMAIASLRAGIEVNRGEPYSYRINPRLLDQRSWAPVTRSPQPYSLNFSKDENTLLDIYRPAMTYYGTA